MRCAIYRRVSTDMQAEEGFSLDAQKIRLQAYTDSQGWTVVDDYCDEGFSAKNTDRPQMQRLIQDVKNKRFDVVLVYRLDRFVRSVLDLHELLQLMDKYDVKFKSATEVFDTTSATGRLFITMIATLAQWERETIAERVHMGMLKKVEQGERNGAPAPYGYDLVDRKLIMNTEEAKWVKYIFNRYGSVGSQQIAKELNRSGVRTKKGEAWSDFAIRYVLKNPIYTGIIRWNYESTSKGKREKTGETVLSEISQQDFEPLIDTDAFQQVQDVLERRSVMAFRSDNFYPFSGVVRCEECGYRFTGGFKKLKSGKIHRYYKCRGRYSMGNCEVQSIAEEAIEEAFLDFLEFTHTEMEIEYTEPVFTKEEIQNQLNHLLRKKERAKELYMDGDISKDKYLSIIAEVKDEEVKCLILDNASDEIQSLEDAKELLRNVKREWFNFSHETKKRAVHSMFESLTIRLVEKAVPRSQKAKVMVTDYKLL